MNKTMIELSNEWWMKLAPLWKKFARETWLCGYDKEDLMQECYLMLVKCLEKYDEGAGVPFESYYKIQLYGWRANQNRKKREVLSINDELYDEIVQSPDPKVNLETQVEDRILFQKIIKELEKMEELDRRIVKEYYIQDKPLKRIAEEIGIKYKAAEFRKGKALKALQSLF